MKINMTTLKGIVWKFKCLKGAKIICFVKMSVFSVLPGQNAKKGVNGTNYRCHWLMSRIWWLYRSTLVISSPNWPLEFGIRGTYKCGNINATGNKFMPHYQDLWWRLQVLWVRDMCCIQNLKIVLHSCQRHARGAKTSQAYDKFQRRILCWKVVLLGTLATAAEPWALAGAVRQCSFVLIMTYIWETAASVAPAVKILVDVWMSASMDSAIFMKRIVIKVSRVLTKPSNNDVNNEKLGLRGLSGAIWCQDMYGLPRKHHNGDVIMGAIASQITSLTIVYSTVYADADKKNQSSASLVFVRGFTGDRWIPRTNGQ